MVERIAGALPVSGAPGPSATRGFEKALQKTGQRAPAASQPKPAARIAQASPAARTNGVEPGSFTAYHERNKESLAALRALAHEHPTMEVRIGHQPLPKLATSAPQASAH